MMKKFVYIIVAFILISMLIGCSLAMTPDERKEMYDLRGSVGDQPFVGNYGGRDARGLMVAPINY
jgi:hypothetical protein